MHFRVDLYNKLLSTDKAIQMRFLQKFIWFVYIWFSLCFVFFNSV